MAVGMSSGDRSGRTRNATWRGDHPSGLAVSIDLRENPTWSRRGKVRVFAARLPLPHVSPPEASYLRNTLDYIFRFLVDMIVNLLMDCVCYHSGQLAVL